MIPKADMSNDAKPDEVKDSVKPDDIKIDVDQHFTNEELFTAPEHMLEWVCMVAEKLGFGIIVGRSDNSST